MQLCLDHGNDEKNIIMIDWQTTTDDVKSQVKELLMNNKIIKLLWGGGGDLKNLYDDLFYEDRGSFKKFLNNLYDIQYLYNEYISTLLKEKRKISLFESLRDMHLISYKKFEVLDIISNSAVDDLFRKNIALNYELLKKDNNYGIYCLSDVLYLKDFFIFFIINFPEDIKKINKKYNSTQLKNYIIQSEIDFSKLPLFTEIDVSKLTLFPEIDVPPPLESSSEEKGKKGEDEALKKAKEYKQKLEVDNRDKKFKILLNYNLNSKSINDMKKELELKDPSNPKAKDKFKGELDIIITDEDGIVYYIFESKSQIEAIIPDSEKIINLINFCNGKNIEFTTKKKDKNNLTINKDTTTIVYTINKKQSDFKTDSQSKTLNNIFSGTFIKLCVDNIEPSINEKLLIQGKSDRFYKFKEDIPDIFKKNFNTALDSVNKIVENFNGLKKEVYVKNDEDSWILFKDLISKYEKPEDIYIETAQLFGTIANALIEKKKKGDEDEDREKKGDEAGRGGGRGGRGGRGGKVDVDKEKLIELEIEIEKKNIYAPVDLEELLEKYKKSKKS
jgi:hypothetical protein